MGETKQGYRNIQAHQKADELALEIYRVTKNFPREEQLGITSQMRRAATSVPANIAEGYTRNSNLDKRRFYNIAQGSLVELEYFIEFSKKLGYLENEDYEKLLGMKDITGKLLYGFTKAVS